MLMKRTRLLKLPDMRMTVTTQHADAGDARIPLGTPPARTSTVKTSFHRHLNGVLGRVSWKGVYGHTVSDDDELSPNLGGNRKES
jgi:hypothetical protein